MGAGGEGLGAPGCMAISRLVDLAPAVLHMTCITHVAVVGRDRASSCCAHSVSPPESPLFQMWDEDRCEVLGRSDPSLLDLCLRDGPEATNCFQLVLHREVTEREVARTHRDLALTLGSAIQQMKPPLNVYVLVLLLLSS